MRRNWRERGEGQMGCVVGLIIFLALIFVAFKMIPIKVKAAELRQEVFDEAKSAGTHNDERIRRSILAKATDLELPVKDTDVKVRRTGNTINIDVEYKVPVKFPGFTYQWGFHHSAENPIF